ncbi:MAG: hypothetical protein ACLFP4_17465 [Spirochaetales bacterium]
MSALSTGSSRQRLPKTYVLIARLGDASAAGDTPRVGEEDHLQQHRRIVGRSAGLVVVVPVLKDGEIDLVVDEIVHRALEGTRLQLRGQADRYHQ